MFRVFVFAFWFSLLFGTAITGNAIGNWIALIALFLLIWSRRRARVAPGLAEGGEQGTSGDAASSSAPPRAVGPPAAQPRSTQTRRSAPRWH